jgi:ketosteroid isomerase-like protein
VTATRDELLERLTAVERRAQALRDVEEIKAFHRDYVRGLADRRFDEIAEHFVEDAWIDMRTHGRKEGRAAIEEHFAPMRDLVAEGSGYVLSSPVIHVDGDRATGRWTWHRYLCEFPVMGAQLRVPGPWMEGRYTCEYVRRDGRWLFSGMWFRVVLPDSDG